MKKNEKVFRVPKNYFLFLAIKTFDRCQKERKRRRENRVRAYAMAREERRTPRSLRRVCYFRFVGSGGGGGRVSPTSWSFYRLLCRRLYDNYLSHFEVIRVFIEHNEHFEIQGVDQWLEGKQIT